jgi:hypothetical protein
VTVIDQLDLFEFEEEDGKTAPTPKRKRIKKKYGPPDYRTKKLNPVPVRRGMPFCIVPEVAPILREVAKQAAIEAGIEEQHDTAAGTYILAARAALVLKCSEATAVRRLYSVLYKKQLFINAAFVEACLMAMDLEREFQYSEWPSCRADALERVSLEAEYAGKKLSPTKLLGKANRLYEKGVRKAHKRAVEVTP